MKVQYSWHPREDLLDGQNDLTNSAGILTFAHLNPPPLPPLHFKMSTHLLKATAELDKELASRVYHCPLDQLDLVNCITKAHTVCNSCPSR